MKFFTRLLTCTLIITLSIPAWSADLPGTGQDTGKIVVYRDTWGVPHIYAPTDEAGLFAQGYAMAEDRPEQLLINLLAGIGQLSAIAGPSAVQSDLRSHMFDHYGVAQRNWDKIDPKVQVHLIAFRDGMNHYYETHPEATPAWWTGRTVDEFMLVAFGRLFLYGWSIDEAYEDLERGGIQAGYDKVSRGSNQFVVAPQRTKNGHAILAIDPHLSWFGPSRFWECRIHAGDLHVSGVSLAGSPYIGLGHNENLAWAMTTGGPDTADVYELTLKQGDDTKYHYDDEWRSMTSKEITLNVRGVGEQTHTLWFSHHGPIIAQRDGKAYAAAMAYADVVNTSAAWYELNYGEDYTGAVRAMETLTVFPQNVMVADTSGNIYYQRTGRVPIRPEEFDYTLPVDGSTSKSEWLGIHLSADHLQVLNPPQGYMQNCNTPPDAMMPNSPFKYGSVPDYLFSSPGYTKARFNNAIHGWSSQRGARAIQLLSKNDAVTVEDAKAIINDVTPYGIDRWIETLYRAKESEMAKEGITLSTDVQRAINDLRFRWSGDLDKDSYDALVYYYWRAQIIEDHGAEKAMEITQSIDDYYNIVEDRPARSLPFIHPDSELLVQSFVHAIMRLSEHYPKGSPTFGTHFRVGQNGKSWPAGGGSLYESRTLRSMSYGAPKADHTQWGHGGQTSTQIVELSKPIKSWGYLPLGQSDDPKSPHFSDQGEKAFSKRELKSSWWTPEELVGHIESRTVLKYTRPKDSQ